MFSIGAMSRRTGVKIPTIRYYEQMGLLPCEGRSTGNQRRYGDAGLQRLSFIKHGRDLGLSLEAIRDLLAIDASDHADTHRIATDHLNDIRHRITRLKRLEHELSRIVASCDGDVAHDCNILRAFGDHATCNGDH